MRRLHSDWLISASNNNCCSSSECLCKSLGFYSSSNFVDWLSGSAWLRLCGEAVVCKHSPRAHDWASSILMDTHTHPSLDQKLVKVWWLRDGSTILPVTLPLSTSWPLSLRQTCLHCSLCQSGDSVRCAITPPPLHTPHPRVKAPGCQTLIACSNNICTFNIMAMLKSSLCSKMFRARGSLGPERPSGNALGHLIQVTLTYFPFIFFALSLSVSR